jgi:rhamnogalacturonyl hydrolase YesR
MPNKACIDRLIGIYHGEDYVLTETLAAINDAVLGENTHHLLRIFEGNPRDPIEIQRRLLSLYQETDDIQYIEAYNELAIRAQRTNEEGGFFPISETYPEFQAILDERDLTLEDLATKRDEILAGL